MMALWMLYAIVTGLLVAVAAIALDRVAVAMRRSTRFIWISAMLATAVWPGAAYLLSRTRVAASAGTWAPITAGLQRASAIVVRASEQTLSVSADVVLAACWAVLTILLVARLAHAVRSLNVRRSSWRTAWIGDIRVLLSADTGPAVVGIDPMEVVLPSWALTLDEPLRNLVLRHEDEHRRARDPYLLLVSALLVVAMPWNIALLWMARRLRLAIELDCDARVLRVHPHHERYGLLLLAIAQRSSGRATLLATAMSEPAFNLARRITAMRTTTRSVSRIRLAGLGIAGAAAIGIACSIDAPTQPAAKHLELTSLRKESPNSREEPATPTTDSGVAYTMKGRDGEYRVNPKGHRAEQGNTISADSMSLERVVPTGPRPVVESGLINPERERAEPERTTREEPARTVLGRLKSVGDRAGAPIIEQGMMGDRRPEPEQQVRAVPGTGTPRYPEALKNARVEGSVEVSLIIDADGRVSAFEVLTSTNPQFTDAVRAAIPEMRFNRAEPGQPAKRMVKLPFVFSTKQ